MKKIILLCAFLFLCHSSLFSQSPNDDIFPLHLGDKWIYLTTPRGGYTCYYSLRETTDTSTIKNMLHYNLKTTYHDYSPYSEIVTNLPDNFVAKDSLNTIYSDGWRWLSISDLYYADYYSLSFGNIKILRNSWGGITIYGVYFYPGIGQFGEFVGGLASGSGPYNMECMRCVIDGKKIGPPTKLFRNYKKYFEIEKIDSTSTLINIYFDSLFDSLEFVNNVSLLSNDEKSSSIIQTAGNSKFQIFYKQNDYNDTLKIIISANLEDKLGFKFDGNRNGIWEGSPIDDVTIFAAQNSVTNVNEPDKDIPVSFTLEQNYPNPFNPSTTINYTLSKSGKTTLSIIDILGRELVKLTDEFQEAGNYSYSWNGKSASGGLPSGIYFYKLKSGSRQEIRKMIMVK